ncbi:MAG: ParB/RepB/Spo0J family partition protein [Alphaproteobacteria bacterium]|nr:ParB/RepB/Spo0J family partition protein [Alphaproteobacteria bacterium]
MSDDSKRRGLGRGLSALLEGDVPLGPAGQDAATSLNQPIEKLRPSSLQPRRRFDDTELAELAQSIRERGILQPILVRPAAEPGMFEIVAGERRWRAAQLARLHAVPVLVHELDDAAVLAAALIENLQRQDLTALEEAQAYRRLCEQFGQTAEQVAELVGKSRSHVANTLRLLHLPEPVKALLQSGSLTAGHARALLAAPSPAALAELVVARGLNVRQTERLAQATPPSPPAPAPQPATGDADTAALERRISASLGLKAVLRHRGTKGGQLRIRYRTLEQLDELTRRLTRGA